MVCAVSTSGAGTASTPSKWSGAARPRWFRSTSTTLRASASREGDALRVVEVDRNHLGRAAPLHFEGVEAVPAPDVETAHTIERRPRQLVGDGSQVVLPRRHHALAEIE